MDKTQHRSTKVVHTSSQNKRSNNWLLSCFKHSSTEAWSNQRRRRTARRRLAIKPATTVAVAAAFTAVASHGLGFFSITAVGHSRCRRGRCATRHRTGHQCRGAHNGPPPRYTPSHGAPVPPARTTAADMSAAHRHPRRLVAPRGLCVSREP